MKGENDVEVDDEIVVVLLNCSKSKSNKVANSVDEVPFKKKLL